MLGLKMSDVGGALGAMLGGGYVNYFSLDGRSYKVIPQVQQRYRLNADQLLDYYIRAAERRVGAAVDDRHDRHQDGARSRSTISSSSTRATIQGVPLPGVSLGEALEYLQGPRRAHAAAGLLGRLRRPVAAVRAGIERLRRRPSPSR